MELTKPDASGRVLVKSYSVGRFLIGEDIYLEPVLLYGDTVHQLSVRSLNDLNELALAPLFQSKPPAEVLLVGAGSSHGLLTQELNKLLFRFGIGVDVMNTGAACRTFNVLALEDRRVAAALLPT